MSDSVEALDLARGALHPGGVQKHARSRSLLQRYNLCKRLWVRTCYETLNKLHLKEVRLAERLERVRRALGTVHECSICAQFTANAYRVPLCRCTQVRHLCHECVLRSIKVVYHTYDLALQCPYCRSWCTYGVEARSLARGDIRVTIRDHTLSPFTIMVPEEPEVGEGDDVGALLSQTDSEDERVVSVSPSSSASEDSDHDYP